jgi:hypothetical protein
MKTPRVLIQPDFASRFTNIWIIEDKLTGFTNYRIDENGNITEEDIPNKEELNAKPFLKLPICMTELLFTTIIEYMNKSGIKTKDENLIEGKLIATEKHLEDMREMSKKMLDALITPSIEIISENSSKK